MTKEEALSRVVHSVISDYVLSGMKVEKGGVITYNIKEEEVILQSTKEAFNLLTVAGIIEDHIDD